MDGILGFLRTAMLLGLLALLGPGLPARDAAELAQDLDRLQVLGSVLYLAAHPDDENTELLAWLSRGRKLRTSYLSLTRGGGGQNRIGCERGEVLAALRTEELLAARRVDGAEQYFTRAEDFGYCKTPERALALWDREQVLADVVWTVRKLRPDVIITRFSPTRGGTHGHHTASAQLALEAFRAAADPARFPEQLAWVQPWQPARLVWNSYRPAPERQAQAPEAVSLDVGGFDPLLGRSYSELAAESTSQHRSQGFGAVAQRGPKLEWFEPLAGTPARSDLFEGIDCTWARVPGGEAVRSSLAQAREAYRPERPAAILPLLLQAKAPLDRLPADPWVLAKRADLAEVIRSAAGIWVEALAERPEAAPGDPVGVTATVIARGADGIALAGCSLVPARPALGPVLAAGPEPPAGPTALAVNVPLRTTFQARFPAGTPCSQPYWLEPGAAPPELAGLAQGPPALAVRFRLLAAGVPFELTAPVEYRACDPVLGERRQPLAVVPPVLVNLPEPVQVLAGPGGRALALVVLAGRAGVSGKLLLRAPAGWRVEPAELPFALARAGDEARLATWLTPPASPGTGALELRVATGGENLPARSLVRIDYPHVPPQALFPLAQVRLVRLDLRRGGARIGYVAGSGDELPGCLRPLGYQVEPLGDEALAGADLAGYDAIILGIRAWNTRPALARLKVRLDAYVAGGGTEIVLYSVDQGLVTPVVGPVPFRISRTRVTDPGSPMTVLAPEHPLLNRPNRITPADFEGWVQERGSYFAEDLDPRFVPVLATADAGEPPRDGSLVVAPHGKGFFIYTGLSFFRQLPAGVPGAYRLFANLLALK